MVALSEQISELILQLILELISRLISDLISELSKQPQCPSAAEQTQQEPARNSGEEEV